MLEGNASEAHALFTCIQQDKQCYRVQAISDCASATRWFADWQMALVELGLAKYSWILGQAEARKHKLVKPPILISSQVLAILPQAFSRL